MAIAVDGTSSGSGTSNSTFSWSHTVTTSGANAVLYVGVGRTATSPANITSVTANGDAMTEFGDQTGGTFARGSVFRLMNPDVGTYNIVVTFAASQDEFAGCAISLTGVDSADPDDTVVSSGGNTATDPSDVVSSATGDLVLDFLAVNQGGAITAGAGQNVFTPIEAEGVGASSSFGMSGEAGAASVTMSWTCEFPWAHLAWNVNVSSGGSGPTLKRLLLSGVG